MRAVNYYKTCKVASAMKWFLTQLAKENLNGKKIELRQSNEFNTFVKSDDPNDLKNLLGAFQHGDINTKLHFSYCIEQLLTSGNDYENGVGYVCANMGRRASYMKGFSQVTKVLLHEFGHQMTLNNVYKTISSEELTDLYIEAKGRQENYVKIPAEWVATQWGIDWLADSEHRKIARTFEKRFWACFE